MEDATIHNISPRLGEVVEASTTGFITQCYELYEAPPLGCLVRSGSIRQGSPEESRRAHDADDSAVFGIVWEIATRSMDPARHPIARGRDEDTEEDVYLSNPQLSRLLLTEFRSAVVGHLSNGQVRRYLAPQPPRIHSFVYRCDTQELMAFSGSLEFVPILLATPITAADDVIAAFLRQASASHPDPERFLIDAGKELASLLGGEMQRLNSLLRRLST